MSKSIEDWIKEIDHELIYVQREFGVFKQELQKANFRNDEQIGQLTEKAGVLLAEIGTTLFTLRIVNWEIHKGSWVAGVATVVGKSMLKLKAENKENIYVLGQILSALQESTRTLRSVIYQNR